MIKSPLSLFVPPVALINLGSAVIVGVALFTVTLTLVVTVLYLAVSVGVNVTLWLPVPALGAVEGVVKANAPSTLALPPLNVEETKVCP